MATLVAIGYPDEATAGLGAREIERRRQDLIIQPDAVAVIVRGPSGTVKVSTSHHAVDRGAMWGMFWSALFGLLYFIPFFGMAVGAGLGTLLGKVETSGIDKRFQDEARDMLHPGTSALFLVVEQVTPNQAMEALSGFGGTALTSSLSRETERNLQAALHGESIAA